VAAVTNEAQRQANRDSARASYQRRLWKPKTFTCRECKELTSPAYPSKRSVFCSDECSGRWQRREGKRWGLTLKRRRAADRIKRMRPRLLARFGGCCGICGRSIDLTLRSPHPGSLTIDHIHPLSAGGSDEETNLWPAHRGCNEAKGDEIGWSPDGLTPGGGSTLQGREPASTRCTHLFWMYGSRGSSAGTRT
jgi:hypothetical protein